MSYFSSTSEKKSGNQPDKDSVESRKAKTKSKLYPVTENEDAVSNLENMRAGASQFVFFYYYYLFILLLISSEISVSVC